MQHSLVVHLIWDQGVAGSNPVIPTIILFNSAGQLSWLEHPVHTRKVVSSSLTPATNEFNLDPQLSWSEHPAHNRRVVGSSPTGSTIFLRVWRNWQTHQTQDLAVYPWGFKSLHPHQFVIKNSHLRVFLLFYYDRLAMSRY